MRCRWLLVPLLGALLVLSSCSSSSHSPKAGPKPTASQTPERLTPTLGTPVRLAAVITTPVLKGSKVFYAYSDQADRRLNRIASTDLISGKRTVLVERPALLGATITSVALTGWPMYVAEAGRGKATPGRARWVVAAVDPSTGQQSVLMEGGPDTQSPQLFGGREATWVVFPDQGGATPKAYSWAPGQGAPRRADAMPGDADECTAPTDHQERVGGCTHQGDWWAWTELPKPGPGALDDPEYLYVSRGDKPFRVAHLGFAAAPPI